MSEVKMITSTFSVSYDFHRNRRIEGIGKILQFSFPQGYQDIPLVMEMATTKLLPFSHQSSIHSVALPENILKQTFSYLTHAGCPSRNKEHCLLGNNFH
jgi:hypothetical protein